MQPINRRDFLKVAATVPAALGTIGTMAVGTTAVTAAPAASPGIIDTNINLFNWPFRKLKYADTTALVTKLKKHRVVEAWAGSFDALLHKDMAGVNERLAAE